MPKPRKGSLKKQQTCIYYLQGCYCCMLPPPGALWGYEASTLHPSKWDKVVVVVAQVATSPGRNGRGRWEKVGTKQW